MAFVRPTTEEELAAIQRQAYDHARRSEYKEALDICDRLIADAWSAAAGYRERAAVHSHMGQIAAAVGDMRTLFALCDDEPADHHTMGLLLLESEDNQEAVGMFSRAIALGEAAGFSYYTESARLLCAEAHARLGELNDARSLLLLVPDGAEAYAFGSGLLSKESILATLDQMPPRPSS